MSILGPLFARYFGWQEGGANLRRAMCELPRAPLARFTEALRGRPAEARVFFFGNGGSFDNARLMAQRCRAHGVAAKVPGDPDDYLAATTGGDYADIFRAGLEQDRIGAGDIAVGLSGSGNSENVVSALAFARARGAMAFCFGGRDGGRMRPVCGDEHALIARNECMEAIEDLHIIALLVALHQLKSGSSLDESLALFVRRFDEFMSADNLRALERIGDGLLATIASGGRMLVLGTGIGANHVRADLGRGATNALPIRGVAAPEFFTMNSAQATANDDGPDFILADGLVKLAPNSHDFALICQLPGSDAAIAHCLTLLDAGGTRREWIGRSGLDLSMFADHDWEFAVAMLGHACGEVIRAHLHGIWQVRALDAQPPFPPGQKKLAVAATADYEQRLRDQRLLRDDEVVTFCYGRAFATRAPSSFALDRCFF